MSYVEIVDVVRSFLAETHSDQVNSIQEDTDLLEMGILDSLLIVSMVVFLEERFGCPLDIEDLTEENFSSLSAIANLILRKNGGDPGAVRAAGSWPTE
jgi:acyl carrier protein